jgi:hypothetical protein
MMEKGSERAAPVLLFTLPCSPFSLLKRASK